MNNVISHLFHKLGDILSSVKGWMAYLVLATANYFSGHTFVVWLVVTVTLLDAVWGIAVSLKQHKFALSELARLTIGKIAVYGCAMFVFVGLDRMIASTLTASVVGAAIVLVEFWSSCGSMIILFPHFLFLRLIRKALTGEIARKLSIPESEVEKVLYPEHNDNK